MTAFRRKVLCDLSQQGTRTVLVVAAIAAGITGFLAVLSSYAILTRELNRGYLATDPASATLRLDSVDDGLLAAVAAKPEIAAAEARRIVSGRIRSPLGDWHTLKLFVAKDFASIRIGKLAPEQGAWPPAAGDILIERDAFSVAPLHAGDTVTVKTTDGQPHALRISGGVHDVGQAQARMENVVYGYVTLDTLALLGETPQLDRLNILVATGRLDEKHIRSVALEVRKLAESRGHTVRSVDVPTPGEHPHAHVMGLLLLVMSSFGFCILALSGILVANLIAAMMALQVRQIGVMKATGATRGQIASIYLLQALLLGSAAIVLALPAGIYGGRQLCVVMAGLLNFDISGFVAPLWVYLLAAAAGWAVPLLAAAYPIWYGSRIPVRVALGEYGVSDDSFGTNRFDFVLSRIGGPLRPLLLALRNSFRRRTRLVLTLTTLVAGGLFFLAGLNIRTSMIHTLDGFFAGRKFDLSVSLSEMVPLENLQRTAANTRGVARAEAWFVGGADFDGEHFNVIGLPPQTPLLKLDIVQGRDLQPGDTGVIVVNNALSDDRKPLAVGDRIALRIGSKPVSVKIVGIARERFSPPTGYMPREYLTSQAGHSGLANSLRLSAIHNDRGSLDQAKTALYRNFEQENLHVGNITSTADTRFSFDQHMLMIYVFLVIVSSIIAAIGGLGLMTTMSLNVLERRREMGVLRAIGASPVVVWLIIVTEGIAVALLGWLLAALAAGPVSRILGDMLWKSLFKSGLDFQLEPSGFLIWLAVSIFLGAIASLLPAWTASRSTVREALSHE